MESSHTAGAVGAGVGLVAILIYLAVVVLMIVSVWKVFTKAGKPGWACLIPVYNLYVMCEIAGKPGWWLILFFIPLVNLVIALLVCIAIAARFGKGAGFGIGLLLLGFIFYPILAFGDSSYQNAPAAPAPAA
jgi:hypothetical protein